MLPQMPRCVTRGAFRFNYPLIQRTLTLCRCGVGGSADEIARRILPSETIPSCTNANRRIVMSATSNQSQ